MTTSNINIVSNIYLRSCDDITKDTEYTSRITGAKRLESIKRNCTGFRNVKFSDFQNRIVSESKPCCLAKNKEQTHGAVKINGNLIWACHCEYEQCERFSECMAEKNARRIERVPFADNEEQDENIEESFRQLDISVHGEIIEYKRNHNINTDDTYKPEKPAPEPETSYDYTIIDTPENIITASLDSHIILNSAPGTGKTYTIIQRLIYLLSNSMCSAEGIYVLCYTRSAKKVVEDKINEAVENGLLPLSAKNICLLTFDSYAAYFLISMKEQDLISENFSEYDYNERIRLFNKYISDEDFEDVEYFIVDEIQDLVNERAEMVLNILKNISCGYMLAGDKCQSIYDYEADKDATLDSVKFYKSLEELFPDDIQKYEISVNKRQSETLANVSSELRKSLLHDRIKEQNSTAKELTAKFSENIKIEKYIKNSEISPTEPTAILCRSNGEAEYISGLLCKQKIPHYLNRGINNINTLPRWIADIFWDYCHDLMSRDEFIERFRFRCNNNTDPESLWDKICKLTDPENMITLNIPKFISSLALENNLPDEFYIDKPLLSVSTIHKAKGSEFEKVILIDSDFELSNDSAEEARVRYVAITRPKTRFSLMKKNCAYFKRTPTGRIIRTNIHKLYDRSNKYCSHIAIGLSGDIDNNSFVFGDFENALETQEYIINNIKIYDRLSAIRNPETKKYMIIHNEKVIGCLSDKMTYEIDLGISTTDYKCRLPDSLDELYVSGITTEILKKFSNDTPIEFQNSRICYGIQITGLAKLTFEKR